MPTPPRRKGNRLHLYGTEDYCALVERLQTNLRQLRVDRGWTQQQAGEACSLTMQQYQRAEAGAASRANLTLTTIARLGRGFGVDVSALFAPLVSPATTGADPH